MRYRIILLCLLVFPTFTINCGGGGDPVAACEAFMTETARLIVRCDKNYTFTKAYDEVLKGSVCDCKKVVRIKDRDRLYNECIPSISRASCDSGDIKAVANNSSCKGQLLVEGVVGLCF